MKAVLSWCTLLRNFWGSCEAKSFSPKCRPSVFFIFERLREYVPKLLSKIQIAFLSSSIFQSFFASWLKMMQSTTQHSVSKSAKMSHFNLNFHAKNQNSFACLLNFTSDFRFSPKIRNKFNFETKLSSLRSQYYKMRLFWRIFKQCDYPVFQCTLISANLPSYLPFPSTFMKA